MLKRSYYYFRQGYSLVTLPFSFLSWSTTIYFLMIERSEVLAAIFPQFTGFILVGSLVTIPACISFGYIFIKKSWFFRETFEITREVNPYANWKIQTVTLPFWVASIELWEKNGIDCTQLREIVEASK
jgi:hypothetical protein